MSAGNNSEARFTINVKEGIVELEGKESFVDKHLEKFEEIFKMAVKEAISTGMQQQNVALKAQVALPQEFNAVSQQIPDGQATGLGGSRPTLTAAVKQHVPRASPTLPPIPVHLKSDESKPGLREFYAEKRPQNHYEKTAVFAYYITKFNKRQEVKFGEILSCYEEVNEKKPSVTDIVKNSVRYKGWLEQGSDKLSTRLTISGENYVKFDMPKKDSVAATA